MLWGCLLCKCRGGQLRLCMSSADTPLDLWICLCLQLVLSSDEAVFGGYENVSKKYDVAYSTQVGTWLSVSCTAWPCPLRPPSSPSTLETTSLAPALSNDTVGRSSWGWQCRLLLGPCSCCAAVWSSACCSAAGTLSAGGPVRWQATLLPGVCALPHRGCVCSRTVCGCRGR